MNNTFGFLTVHINLASYGEIVSSISWPCKHNPASKRNESLAPSPQNYVTLVANNESHNYYAYYASTEISYPSSPV